MCSCASLHLGRSSVEINTCKGRSAPQMWSDMEDALRCKGVESAYRGVKPPVVAIFEAEAPVQCGSQRVHAFLLIWLETTATTGSFDGRPLQHLWNL